MNEFTIQKTVHFGRGQRGRRQIHAGEAPDLVASGRVPRVTRLMALAIHMDRLIREGEVGSYADLASLGSVSRARVSQIMNLLYLAPDVQEELLFLPRVERGRDPIREHMVRPIAATLDWRKQRGMWGELVRALPGRS